MISTPPAFRHRDFRLFWSGLACSAIGAQFSTVAMAWQVYQLTGSPLQIGLLGLSRAIPTMLLSLLGGLFADAIDRRKLLAVSQITQSATALALLTLSVTGAITPLALYVATALSAVFTALETPTRNSLVPNLVPDEDLSSAMALNVSQRNLGTIVGPSLAGVVIALVGATWCYAVDCLSRFALLAAVGGNPTACRPSDSTTGCLDRSAEGRLRVRMGTPDSFDIHVPGFRRHAVWLSSCAHPDLRSGHPRGRGRWAWAYCTPLNLLEQSWPAR